MEDHLNERRPQWKSTSMKDDINGSRVKKTFNPSSEPKGGREIFLTNISPNCVKFNTKSFNFFINCLNLLTFMMILMNYLANFNNKCKIVKTLSEMLRISGHPSSLSKPSSGTWFLIFFGL